MGDVIVSMEHITKEFPGVKALDDNTLQVTLVRPVNYFDRLVGFPVFFPQNQKFVEEKGMVQLSDPAKLQPIVDEVVAANPQSVEDFHNGKDRAIGFLVGQIMKQTHGQANPKVVNQILMAEIKQR